MVEVHFFKDSGKWYSTETVDWTRTDGLNYLPDEFAEVLIKHLKDDAGKIRLLDMTAVCIEPNHTNSHPQMLKVREAFQKHLSRSIK